MSKIVVIGAGKSGIGAAILAQKKGFDVFVSDFGTMKEEYKQSLREKSIPFEEEGHTETKILQADQIIKSPGVPDNVSVIVSADKIGIPVISEIEFAGRYTNAKKICITGSNGKTTTTLLTYHIFKKAGFHVGLAGNVGQSFALQVAENDYDYYIIELSSFQLDGLSRFKADVAVLLNITPDHLDRYGYSFEAYVDSKFRMLNNQTEQDFFIYCDDDATIQKKLKNTQVRAESLPFSIFHKTGKGAFIDNDTLIVQLKNSQFNMSIQELALEGSHNIYNSMAAGIAAKIYDIRKEDIRESLSGFEGVEHRLEYIMRVHGIHFINDSKATNVNSTWYALESMKNPTIWILGGVDKGNDYNALMDLVNEKVKAIIALGIDNSKIHKAFEGVKEIIDVTSMEEAVRAAYYLGNDGDNVLLSPACASFDLFENYEDRGRKFKEAVRLL
jgi:UDP-N-acetylmuramoylalanine--D-glutamate ligase